MKRSFLTGLTWLIFAIICSNLTACGTVISLTNGNYAVYGGVMHDFSVMQTGGLLSVLAVIDLPLSFVFDTLLLPVTLSQ